MDVLLDFDTSGFDFSNLENMVEITETSAPVHQTGDLKKKRDKLAARACVLCNQAHTACDNGMHCCGLRVGGLWLTVLLQHVHAVDVFPKELLICVGIRNQGKGEGLQRYVTPQHNFLYWVFDSFIHTAA